MSIQQLLCLFLSLKHHVTWAVHVKLQDDCNLSCLCALTTRTSASFLKLTSQAESEKPAALKHTYMRCLCQMHVRKPCKSICHSFDMLCMFFKRSALIQKDRKVKRQLKQFIDERVITATAPSKTNCAADISDIHMKIAVLYSFLTKPKKILVYGELLPRKLSNTVLLSQCGGKAAEETIHSPLQRLEVLFPKQRD